MSPEKKIPMTLAAAYPRWPWSDLVAALTPNGRFLDFDASTADKSRFPPGVPIRLHQGMTRSATRRFTPRPADQPPTDGWNARVSPGAYADPDGADFSTSTASTRASPAGSTPIRC